MMLPVIAFFCFASQLVSSNEVLQDLEVLTKPPVDPCDGVVCRQFPPYMTCARMYIPTGTCCPVCSCSDDNGKEYSVDRTFIFKKQGQCNDCDCFLDQHGVKMSFCHLRYCPPANCPKHIRELTDDGCCEKCPARRPRTFPPRGGRRPFPPRGQRTFPPRS